MDALKSKTILLESNDGLFDSRSAPDSLESGYTAPIDSPNGRSPAGSTSSRRSTDSKNKRGKPLSLSGESIRRLFETTFEPESPSEFLHKLGEVIIEDFSDVRLIGELERPEGKGTYDALIDCLQKVLQGYKRFPFSLFQYEAPRAVISLYFVWTGIFCYGEGHGNELWPPVFEGLRVWHDGNIQRKCGDLFGQCLEENDLETFRRIKSTHLHVTRILLHGLVPDKHIKRFITDVVLSHIGSSASAHQTADGVIRAWETGTEKSFRYMPKPIQNFLLHGRPVNVDLIDRFLNLSERWEDDDSDAWWQWKLPKYMVDAFRVCVNASGTSGVPRTARRTSGSERTHLLFDLERSENPVLVLPRRKCGADPVLRIRENVCNSSDNKVEEKTVKLETPIKVRGNHYSEARHLPISPAEAWHVELVDASGEEVFKKESVFYEFPQGEEGKRVPVFFFNSESGKALELGKCRRTPKSLVAVYPTEAKLETQGLEAVTDPLRLTGTWSGWKSQFFARGKEAECSLLYTGPDSGLTKEIVEVLPLSEAVSQHEEPSLSRDLTVPGWLHCGDGLPIFTHTDKLELHFTKEAFPLWRKSVATLARMDVPDSKPVRAWLSRDQQPMKGGVAASLENVRIEEPGVYELRLRGALGMEEAVFPFAYLPISQIERGFQDSGNVIADRFLVRFEKAVNVEPLGNTLLSFPTSKLEAFITLENDQGDGFCALRVFPDSEKPLTLLLARSDIRWVRHSESGLREWMFWRARPEEIPIQRVDELQDARVLVQVDEASENQTLLRLLGAKKRLDIQLFTFEREGSEKQFRSVTRASSLKSGASNTWVFDMKQFSDAIRSLQDIQGADIVIPVEDHQQILLFQVKRYPNYRGFSVRSLGHKGDHEKIEVRWEAEANEPAKNRFISLHCADRAQDLQMLKIEDGDTPPIHFELHQPTRPEIWHATIEIVRSRFGTAKQGTSAQQPFATFLRIPPGHCDWLEFSCISPGSVCQQHPLAWETPIETKLLSFPWLSFLDLFHNSTGPKDLGALFGLIGREAISELFPFTKGSSWDVKAGSRLCMRLSVVSVETGIRDVFDYFAHVAPAQWYDLYLLSPGAAVRLHTDRYHRYMGERGTKWFCSRQIGGEHPIMRSDNDGVFDLPIWLADVIGSDQKGALVAKAPLERMWDNPPPFPILKKIPVKDPFFPSGPNPRQDVENGSSRNGRQGWAAGRPAYGWGGNFKISIADQLARAQRDAAASGRLGLVAEPKDRESALALARRWSTWVEKHGVNPFFRRLIQGRTQSPVSTVTGALAFVERLKAHGLEKSIYRSDVLLHGEGELQKLCAETKGFVEKHLRQAFLRDLIISEILVCWYWQKRMAMTLPSPAKGPRN